MSITYGFYGIFSICSKGGMFIMCLLPDDIIIAALVLVNGSANYLSEIVLRSCMGKWIGIYTAWDEL
jgi:hypothetical protein